MDDHELLGISDDLPPFPFRWDLLDDEERLERSRELHSFVNWLVARYRLHRRIPPCWWRHGASVEELSALFIAWRGVMEASDRPDSWLSWHHHLGLLLERCAQLWSTGCTPDQHTDPTTTTLEHPPAEWSGVV